MKLHIETEQEIDGRWIAEVIDLPGALAYGATPQEAIAKAKALAQTSSFRPVSCISCCTARKFITSWHGTHDSR